MNQKIVLISILLICISSGSSVSAEISVQSSSEGQCITPEPKPAKFDIEWALEFGQRAKYVPMGSQLYYTYTAEVLRGAPLQNLDELDNLCNIIDSRGFSSTISGFGVDLNMDCEIKDIGSVNCGPPSIMNDDDLTDEQRSQNATFLVAAWTDHKNYLLTIQCFPGGLKAWNVVSDKKKMDGATKETIFQQLTPYGFDVGKAREASYEKC